MCYLGMVPTYLTVSYVWLLWHLDPLQIVDSIYGVKVSGLQGSVQRLDVFVQVIPKYLDYEKIINTEEIISYSKSPSLFCSHTENIECSKIRFVELKTKNHQKCVSYFMYLTNPLVFSYTTCPHHKQVSHKNET